MDRQAAKEVGAGPSTAAWAFAARIVVGIILVASGTLKAAAPPEEFSVIIESYQLLSSPDLIMTIAAFLPWIEVILGFSLVFGFQTQAASAAAGGIFMLFIAALSLTILRGVHLPNCGCFGFGWHPSPPQTLLLDFFLTACCLLSYRQGRSLLSLDNWRAASYTGDHA